MEGAIGLNDRTRPVAPARNTSTAQHLDMVDVSCSGHHRGHDGQNLAARQGQPSADPPIDQRLEAQPGDQRAGQDQPCVGDQPAMTERRFKPVEIAR